MSVLRLVDIRDTALSVDECLTAVTDASAGGTAVFVGTVRDHDDGRGVVGLEYLAHPDAVPALRRVAEAVAADLDLIGVAVVHRVGRLDVGDLAVVIAVSAAHRGAAFTGCRRLIEDLKASVPIWKRQELVAGPAQWVGLP